MRPQENDARTGVFRLLLRSTAPARDPGLVESIAGLLAHENASFRPPGS